METNFENRNENNPIIREQYNKENYVVHNCNESSNLTYVFFSGNGLYYPDTKDNFQKKIVQENRYEWENIARSSILRKKAHRIILVRDLFESWYVLGINGRENNIEKAASIIQELAEGDEIVTVGNSAGGYMAVVTGILIGARRCICASPQFDILLYDDHNILINKYCNQLPYKRYLDISDMVKKTDMPIYYIYPCHCEKDILQYSKVKDSSCLRMLYFGSDQHGAMPMGAQLPYLLIKNEKELDSLSEKIGENSFGAMKWLLVSEGYGRAVTITLHKFWRKILKKLVRKKR